MEGPPEMVEGMVMNVMTSCSLRPANRARKPPIAWIPSCELPAIRKTASETLETFGSPGGGGVSSASLMKIIFCFTWSYRPRQRLKKDQCDDCAIHVSTLADLVNR